MLHLGHLPRIHYSNPLALLINLSVEVLISVICFVSRSSIGSLSDLHAVSVVSYSFIMKSNPFIALIILNIFLLWSLSDSSILSYIVLLVQVPRVSIFLFMGTADSPFLWVVSSCRL